MKIYYSQGLYFILDTTFKISYICYKVFQLENVCTESSFLHFVKPKFNRPSSQISFIEKAKLLNQITIKKELVKLMTSTVQ